MVWLSAGHLDRISHAAQEILERAELLISPIAMIELEYLYEIRRIKISARDVQLKVEHEMGVRVCDLPFPAVARIALDEKWTRDPFDRLIVAQAKANGLAPLLSADEEMSRHYPRTVW